jgi:tellurite methyltransferase
MDDTDNRALWDRKYEEGLPSLTKPDPFFVSAYERLVDRSFPNGGMALDLAAGLGRHALETPTVSELHQKRAALDGN